METQTGDGTAAGETPRGPKLRPCAALRQPQTARERLCGLTAAERIRTMTTRQSGVARTKRAKDTPRPQSVRMIQLGAHWTSLTAMQKQAWNMTAATAANVLSPFSPTTQTGYGLFVSINNYHLDTGNNIQSDSPVSYAPAVPMQPVRCAVTVVDGVTTVTLSATSAYMYSVLLYAAKPCAAANVPRRPGNYVLLTRLNYMEPSTDVSAAVLGRFPFAEPGMQLSLKLVPVSASGFRGAPLYVTGYSLAPGQTLPAAFDPDAKKARPATNLKIA